VEETGRTLRKLQITSDIPDKSVGPTAPAADIPKRSDLQTTVGDAYLQVGLPFKMCRIAALDDVLFPVCLVG